MFRNRPLAFCLLIVFFFAGLLVVLASDIIEIQLGGGIVSAYCLVVFVIWYLKCLTTRLEITTKKSIVRRGILSKHIREVRHCDVRFIGTRQGVLQRIFDVGQIAVGSAGHGGVELVVRGVPRPVHIKETIDRYRP